MKFELNALDNVLVIRLPRQLAYDHLLEAANYLAGLDENLAVSPHRLTDFSAAEEVALHFTEIEAFANQRRKAKLKNHVKSAIVAGTPMHMGFARMFQTLNDHPQMTLKIFPDAASAWLWLRSPDTTL